VKLSLTSEKDGYMADAAVTVPVQPVQDRAARLAACADGGVNDQHVYSAARLPR
jgi:methionine aminopeptidase